MWPVILLYYWKDVGCTGSGMPVNGSAHHVSKKCGGTLNTKLY